MTTEPSPPAALPASLERGSVAALEGEGWVTARPPKAIEVVRRIVTFPRLLAQHRDLILLSVRRELQARFQGTLLGWAWPLVYPVFLFTVYYFIFTKLLAMRFPDLPESQQAAMGVYMFVGVLIWTAFAESLARGCNVIVENGNLIKKLAFPSETLPLEIVLVNVVTMLFGVVVFALTCFFTPLWLSPGWGVLWVPLLLLLQVVFTFGFTLMLATLQVFLRDTMQVVGIAVTVWMFVTPVFWAPEIIHSDFFEENIGLIRLNPAYHLVYAWRYALMSAQPGVIFPHALGHSLWVLALWSVGVFVVGYGFFVFTQRRFSDEI